MGRMMTSTADYVGREGAQTVVSPWEEVGDFFHYCDNYVDAVDRTAEHFITAAGPGKDPLITAAEALKKRGIDVQFSNNGPLRQFDPGARRLDLSARAAAPISPGKAAPDFE